MPKKLVHILNIVLWWSLVIFAVVGMAVVLHLSEARGAEPDRDTALRQAIEWVESRGNHLAYNKRTDAAGCMQIRPIMVEDVNRILRHQGKVQQYTTTDRFDCEKSHEMFWIYTSHYSGGASREVIARRWYGGPDGDEESNTYGYWQLVKARLLEQHFGSTSQ